MASPAPRGPRSRAQDTRADILNAARELFLANGFQRTTLRAVARAAGVDVALIGYYFGGKDRLFVQALGYQADPPSAAFKAALSPSLAGAGERLVRTALIIWAGEPAAEALRRMLSHASQRDRLESLARDYLDAQLRAVFVAHMPGPEAGYRAALVVSQLIGLTVMRRVFGVTTLQEAELERLVADVAPVVQYYLTGPLPGSAARRPGSTTPSGPAGPVSPRPAREPGRS